MAQLGKGLQSREPVRNIAELLDPLSDFRRAEAKSASNQGLGKMAGVEVVDHCSSSLLDGEFACSTYTYQNTAQSRGR
jgi:hypothetical protein